MSTPQENLPISWTRPKLKDVATLSGRIGWKGLTAKEYTESGPLFLSVHSLNYGDYVDYQDAFHISQARYDESPEIMLQPDDILICKDGAGIGKVGIISTLPSPSTINSSLLLIRSEANVEAKYLYYLLLSPYFQHIVQSKLEGATTPHLYQRDIKEFPVQLAPLPEQKRIVTILDDAFARIGAAIANTEKNIANTQELFESYLNGVFDQKGDGWEEKTLQEVSIDFGRGKSKHRPRNDKKLYGGQYPFIQTGDIRKCSHIVRNYTQTYNEVGLTQSKLWPQGTICITIAANIAETGILGFNACFPDSVIGIVVDPTITSNSYVEFLLQSVKSSIKKEGKGSAQDNINLKTFEKKLFPFPPLNEQVVIVDKLNALRMHINAIDKIYQQKLTALHELKQSILQKAFTGELTANMNFDEQVA